MCTDCGCQEGNERAYFGAHGHDHSHDHSHDHHHVAHVPTNGREVHIHIHLDGASHGQVHTHTHQHPHDAHENEHHHDHAHSHSHSHDTDAGTADERRRRTIQLESKVLARNDERAAINRSWLAERGVAAVNIISSPGSGKTYLLERTLEALEGKIKCAVITGDQQTDNDAKRLAGKGAPVVQIETRSSCHLNADQVAEELEAVVRDGVELLFIENVGNLVCPAAFDLGEQTKIALLSVTEGEDKPLKYPVIFHDASVTVITKTDLLPHLEFDLDRCRESVRQVRSRGEVFELSAKTGEGMDAWLAYLGSLIS